MREIALFILCCFVLTANAVEYKTPTQQSTIQMVPKAIDIPYARDYLLLGKGIWNNNLERIVLSDQLFLAGNNMLADPSYYISRDTPASMDPESSDHSTIKKSMPDMQGVIKKLVLSAKTYQNPVSAYEAVELSMKYFGKSTSSPIYGDIPVLSKLLYNYEVCDGYMLYGEQLEKSGNVLGAYEVYKKGAENQKCTGWYQSVIGGKISVLRKSIEKK